MSMNPAEVREFQDNLAAMRQAMRAYMQFRDDVGGLMLALVERGDPSGLVLLEMVRDLEARTGEFVMNGED